MDDGNGNSKDPPNIAKTQKRVTFDIKPASAIHIARKSAIPCTVVQSIHRRYKNFPKKEMLLELKKVDITGYDIPRQSMFERECSVLYGCARLLSVDEVSSCARTSAVRNNGVIRPRSSNLNVDQKPSISPSLRAKIYKTMKGPSGRSMFNKVNRRKHVSTQLKSVMKLKSILNKGLYRSDKSYKKSSKVAHPNKKPSTGMMSPDLADSRKRVREPEEKHVNFTLSESVSSESVPSESVPSESMNVFMESLPSTSSSQDMTSAQLEYELKLKETIEKMTGEPAPKKKK